MRWMTLTGVATLALLAGTLATAPAGLARPSLPQASGVAIHEIVPSTISRVGLHGDDGAFQEAIVMQDPSPDTCGFHLHRHTANAGNTDLGYFSGTSTTDLVHSTWGETTYEMDPTDCSGNAGSPVYSQSMVPRVMDNPFTIEGQGVGAHPTNSQVFGGSSLVTTSKVGTRVRWAVHCCVHNIGIVIATDPKGGVGTLYVDGKQQGLINFYSQHLIFRKLAAKWGSLQESAPVVEIVMTGRGGGGGYQMSLDAGTKNVAKGY